MKKFLGNFLGLTIQNNDPEKRGRIKIWVPHVSVTVYDKWNEDKTLDKNIIFPDKNLDADLSAILPDLKRILPWAECALPIFGGSASGRYNAIDERGSTSDSNYWTDDFPLEGKRPSEMFKKDYPDAFTEVDAVGNRFVNPHAHQYKPSPYSNLARGLFSIPNVGAHVWVFFQDGDPKYPVYFGVMYGQEDWKRIYDLNQATGEPIEDFGSTDYPQSFENVDVQDGGFLNTDTKTFRAKTVFNSNKHSIELIDTDLREILKMTHYSGSFLEFNNFTTSQLAVGNDQKLVTGDQFLTVKKNQSSFVNDHQESIVGGDVYRTIGQMDRADVEQIKAILQDIHDRKRLFEIKRTAASVTDSCGIGYENGTGVSLLQSQAGAPPPCPTCCAGKEYQIVKNECDAFILLPCTCGVIIPGLHLIEPKTGACGSKWVLPCRTCCGSGISPSTQDGSWAVDPLKVQLQEYIKAKQLELFPIQRKLGNGGNEIVTIHGNKMETIGQLMNDFRGWRVDPIGKIRVAGVQVDHKGTYEYMRPAPIVEYVDVDPLPGGDYNCTASNKYRLLVGGGGVHIKTFGNIEMYGGIVTVAGEQVNITSKGEVMISGSSRVALQGKSISLDPTNYEQAVINGGLGVTRNLVVNGATHHEGEVYLHHITAPLEFQTTECADSLKCASLFPCIPPPPPSPASIDPTAASLASVAAMWAWMALHTHWMPPNPHYHYFKNVPLDLWCESREVRKDACDSGINSTAQLPSKPVRTPIPNCCLIPWTCFLGAPCFAPSFRIVTPIGGGGVSGAIGAINEATGTTSSSVAADGGTTSGVTGNIGEVGVDASSVPADSGTSSNRERSVDPTTGEVTFS